MNITSILWPASETARFISALPINWRGVCMSIGLVLSKVFANAIMCVCWYGASHTNISNRLLPVKNSLKNGIENGNLHLLKERTQSGVISGMISILNMFGAFRAIVIPVKPNSHAGIGCRTGIQSRPSVHVALDARLREHDTIISCFGIPAYA
jgi:hypothetical protein